MTTNELSRFDGNEIATALMSRNGAETFPKIRMLNTTFLSVRHRIGSYRIRFPAALKEVKIGIRSYPAWRSVQGECVSLWFSQ